MMGKTLSVLTFLCLALVALSCTSDEVAIVNKWQLSEVLVDPGNGSGTFNPVDSDLFIHFFEDSTFETNAFGCLSMPDFESENSENKLKKGKYNLNNATLYISSCDYSYSFELNDEILTVHTICIETCGLKFRLVE